MLNDENGISQPYCEYCMKWLSGELVLPDEEDGIPLEDTSGDNQQEVEDDDWDDTGINELNDY